MLLADATKTRHYRVHLSASNCTLLSIFLNLVLLLVVLHSWSQPCAHIEAEHLSTLLTPPAHVFQTKALTASPASPSRTLQSNPEDVLSKLWTPPPPSPSLDIPHDLSLNASFSLSQHAHTWRYCDIGGPTDPYLKERLEYCPQTANAEQKYQMSWFGTHVVPGVKRPFPKYLNCVHLPPRDYRWPEKQPPLPAPAGSDGAHWPNFRVSSYKELRVFNEATPKNLYHFDAPQYDLDALGELSWAARYIPFGPKVRNMLDVGAGGGSLGLLLHRKYDVQVLATVFADWPYCEYITERGGLCMLVDVMEPMPFAKFTWDVLHISWVYHGQQPDELIVMFNEINRVLRPGGYLWMRGGWARRQVDVMQALLVGRLGYEMLVSEEKPKPKDVTARMNFGGDRKDLPYELDWNVVLVKPIRAEQSTDCKQ